MKEVISQCIHATAQEVNLEKDIISLSNNVNMTYNYLTDEISFDAERIADILHHYPHITLHDYVTTFTLHELGHSLDRDNLLDSYDQTVELYRLSRQLNASEQETDPQFLQLSYLESKSDLHFEYVAWSHAIRLNDIHQLVSPTILEELKNDSLLTYEDNCAASKEAWESSRKTPILL